MSEMIERVARAICRAGICGPRDHLNEQEDRNWRKFELEARAAIAAMREPTEAMITAADVEVHSDFLPPHMTWERMIDAALKE